MSRRKPKPKRYAKDPIFISTTDPGLKKRWDARKKAEKMEGAELLEKLLAIVMP